MLLYVFFFGALHKLVIFFGAVFLRRPYRTTGELASQKNKPASDGFQVDVGGKLGGLAPAPAGRTPQGGEAQAPLPPAGGGGGRTLRGGRGRTVTGTLHVRAKAGWAWNYRGCLMSGRKQVGLGITTIKFGLGV